jgi:hypothetical protein
MGQPQTHLFKRCSLTGLDCYDPTRKYLCFIASLETVVYWSLFVFQNYQVTQAACSAYPSMVQVPNHHLRLIN